MATRRGQSPEVLWSFLPRPHRHGGDGIFGRATVNVVPWPSPAASDCARPYLSRSRELFPFPPGVGNERIRRTRRAGREKGKRAEGDPSRLPPGYFFRPIMAAMAPITTSARTATMIVVVSRPAITRGSTVPTRCSAITVVLPVPSEWPVAVTVATTRNCVRGPTSAVNVVVNLPWTSVVPDAAATFPPSPMTSRLTVAPETADPPDVTVTVIVAGVPGAIVTADEVTATARARMSGVTVIHADVVAPA